MADPNGITPLKPEIMPVGVMLSDEERRDRDEGEEFLEGYRKDTLRAGAIILDFHDRKLYRETHATFEAWCRDRGMTRQRAYQLMDGTKVAGDVNSELTSDIPPISSEVQARAVAGLPKEKRAETYRKAVKDAGGKAPTAKQVRAAVQAVAPETAPPPPEPATGYTVILRPENQARFEAHCRNLGVNPTARIVALILQDTPKPTTTTGPTPHPRAHLNARK